MVMSGQTQLKKRKINPESQKTEYKSSWQDDFFEWICGYANSKGGTLYIGVNDDGYVVGLGDTRYLLDTLPNQVVAAMGIVIEIDHDVVNEMGTNIKYNIVPDDIAQKPENLYVRGILTAKVVDDIINDPDNITNVSDDVRKLFDTSPGFVKQLRKDETYREKIKADINKWDDEHLLRVGTDGELEYVIISVSPYHNGISYHGHYYIRSGGTTRELTSISLNSFLMERNGKHWDAVPMPGVRVEDLNHYAIDQYRIKAVKNNRHTEAEVNVSDEQIISDLQLFDISEDVRGNIENRILRRAGVLLFHPEPEKYVTGAYVKVAYFAPEGAYGENKSDDIIYHDEVYGSLMILADKVVDIVYTKYLKALISYDGLQRIETFMTPKEAFREVILNAINHKVYESGNPIQISVYEDRIVVFNQGNWPEDISLDDLYLKKHSSYPHNPSLSNVFFHSGEIEAYGTGFKKIKLECDKANAPYPELEITPNGVTVEIKACDLYMKLLRHGRYWQTYPDYKEKSDGYLATEEGDVITTEDGEPLMVQTEKEVDPTVIASIDRMMEILINNLSDSEKEIYLPIAEYLKTHDTIKNADIMKLTQKGSTSANRYLNRLVGLKVLNPEGNKKGRFYHRVSG